MDQHIGARIRFRRKLVNLTQDDLAAKIGVTAQQIHKYETGANRVAASTLFEIATALNAPVAAFFEELPAGASEGDEQRMLLEKEILEVARNFFRIEEEHVRKLVLKILRAATEGGDPQE
jgi:transcriptional regulator with XRE-family HTH domain